MVAPPLSPNSIVRNRPPLRRSGSTCRNRKKLGPTSTLSALYPWLLTQANASPRVNLSRRNWTDWMTYPICNLTRKRAEPPVLLW